MAGNARSRRRRRRVAVMAARGTALSVEMNETATVLEGGAAERERNV